MVRGLATFAAAFAGHENQYVLIGGAAAHQWFARAQIDFRATQDLDLVLCVGALDPGFVQRFWSFVQDGGYARKERSDGTPIRYRFSKPTAPDYPKMLELFASTELDLSAEQTIVPIAVEEHVSDLSGILLDEDYNSVVMSCRANEGGITCLTPEGLILLKARAWLDLTARVASGEAVDSRHIKKHRNDVFRIAVLLGEHMAGSFPLRVLEDLRAFLHAVVERDEEWSAIATASKTWGTAKPDDLVEVLRENFDLQPGE